MGKNLVSKPMHEWSLCFHLSFALLLVFELQVKIKGCYKRSQRHLPHWVENVLWPGIWLLSPGRTLKTVAALTRAPSEQQCMAGSCSKWTLFCFLRGDRSAHAFSSQPLRRLSATFLLEHQPAAGFPSQSTVISFKMIFKTLKNFEKVIPLGWFNAARPECFMINFSDGIHDTVSSSDEVGRGNKTAVYSFSHIIL